MAFSREQKDKVYVQHRLKTESKLCSEFIFGLNSFIIIVGNSKFLPKAIDKSLLEIFQKEKQMEESEALKFLNQLKRNKIYYHIQNLKLYLSI